MANKVAINGFGRIGRVALRIWCERLNQGKTDLNVVAINDPGNAEDLAFLLKYDSVHGRFAGEISHDKESITVNGRRIHVSAEREPAALPWGALDIDVVFESSGRFLTREAASGHLTAGAKRVLLSAPGHGDLPDATICYGVNHSDFKPAMKIISTASCTTNCIAPIAKILQTQWGIKKAMVTTIHSYTNDQHLLDLNHKDKRRARAAALSMIPTSTGAAQAVALVIPELKDKFQGLAVRVPTPNVSLVDLVAIVDKGTTTSQVNAALKEAATGQFKGILGFEEEPLVSVDMLGSTCSSIVDAPSTMVQDGDMVKILAWYDNEWGFTSRAVDLLELMASA
jgi:glyceraldehyde-3-phosphate dehydrogenase type I